MRTHSCYLREVFEDPIKFHNKVNEFVKLLRKRKNVNAIVASGVSGITFASAMAYKMKLPLVVVRKKREKTYSHAETMIEGGFNGMQYIIVDDLISSGATMGYIANMIHEKHDYVICRGYMLYNSTNTSKDSPYHHFPTEKVAVKMVKDCANSYPLD